MSHLLVTFHAHSFVMARAQVASLTYAAVAAWQGNHISSLSVADGAPESINLQDVKVHLVDLDRLLLWHGLLNRIRAIK